MLPLLHIILVCVATYILLQVHHVHKTHEPSVFCVWCCCFVPSFLAFVRSFFARASSRRLVVLLLLFVLVTFFLLLFSWCCLQCALVFTSLLDYRADTNSIFQPSAVNSSLSSCQQTRLVLTRGSFLSALK